MLTKIITLNSLVTPVFVSKILDQYIISVELSRSVDSLAEAKQIHRAMAESLTQ